MKNLLSILQDHIPDFAMYVPFMSKIVHTKSRDELLEFWRHPIPGDGQNLPLDYLWGEERGQFLVGLIKRYVGLDAKILEIGCNVGRNLNYLFNAGYTNLGGG